MSWLLRTVGVAVNTEGLWWNAKSGTTRFMPWQAFHSPIAYGRRMREFHEHQRIQSELLHARIAHQRNKQRKRTPKPR